MSTARGRVANHLHTLAMLWLIYSAFTLLGGFAARTFLSHFYWFSGGFHVPYFLPRIFDAVIGFVLARGVLGLIVGWGLHTRQSWARMGAIVLAFFQLIHIPLGTALGIYTLWVLMPAESEQEYRTQSSFPA